MAADVGEHGVIVTWRARGAVLDVAMSAESMPTRLCDDIGSRAALRLPTQAASDMMLRTGMQLSRVSPTAFTSRRWARLGSWRTTWPGPEQARAW